MHIYDLIFKTKKKDIDLIIMSNGTNAIQKTQLTASNMSTPDLHKGIRASASDSDMQSRDSQSVEASFSSISTDVPMFKSIGEVGSVIDVQKSTDFEARHKENEIPDTYRNSSNRSKDKESIRYLSQSDDVDIETYPSWWDFHVLVICITVGMGSVNSFPQEILKCGGGAYLIPYLIFLIAIFPIHYVESWLGQFTSRGPIACWEFARLFQGVGFSMIIASTLITLYYTFTVALQLQYAFASFGTISSSAPWESCCTNDKHLVRNHWNTDKCQDMQLLKSLSSNKTFTVESLSGYEYFHHEVLGLDLVIDRDMWGFNGKLVGCLLLSWVITAAVVLVGI